ncbi:hypothetical protein [Xanthomonas phage f20-Xaj]|uniref:Uncharacterized protein n=2 Tax=Pradovirus TaxID=1985733 RepID=A0A127AYD6_9CAUD|nr:hypothetical protein FDI07_gp14 [Xanthomonas phage f20-Xaj]YP_009276342.1 hypothetical protein FDI08_gp41 [Xanthomonas phage f30-Xaj]AMM44678.1 hypothetical protein [Xanthomonas phage f20-Xaj]AMM44721.1 hypothetical protein [Xanthomonas phage f30-Xaj]
MIRCRFSPKYAMQAFDSWFRAMDKHGCRVSDLTHDSTGYHYTVTP